MREFEQYLAWLREVAYPCAPPVGVGEFEVLYASAHEVVVWYSPAREGHRAGEVAIPCGRLAAAWEALRKGTALDEAALTQLGEGVGGGRWLLALLALLPGARVLAEPLRLELLATRPIRRRPAAHEKSATAVKARTTRTERASGARTAATAKTSVKATRKPRAQSTAGEAGGKKEAAPLTPRGSAARHGSALPS